MNFGVFSRNIALYSHPLSTENNKITTDSISFGGLGANLIRNGTSHLALPLPNINQYMTEKVSDFLGDYNDDPRFLFQDTRFEIKFSINEDDAGNLLHFLFLIIAVICYPWCKREDKRSLSLILGSFLIMILFYSLLVKWQPWGGRLQLPIFLFGSPLVGLIIEKGRLNKILSFVILISLVSYSIPFLMLNSTRPLVPLFRHRSPLRNTSIKRWFSDRPDRYIQYAEIISPFYRDASILRTDREEQYFAGYPLIFEDYVQILDTVSQLDPEVVGLDLDSDTWEYPIWAFSGNHAINRQPLFIHVGVENITTGLGPYFVDSPVYIVSSKGKNSIFIDELGYKIIFDTPTLDLLEKR